jgi:cytochrome c biogenesis protein ResB
LFYTPVFIALGFALSAANLVAVIKRWKKPGFVLMHLGIVVLLVGGFIGHLRGVKGSMVVPLYSPAVSTMQLKDGTEVPIPVKVESLGFSVEHYAPHYTRYVRGGGGSMVADVDFELDVEAQEVTVEGYGQVQVDQFRMGRMWLPRVALDDGSILVQQSMTPKRYETKLRFDADKVETVIINYPVSYKGWRFYLMSYDQRAQQYVVLTARHDPGRMAVVVGIWMVIIGAFVMSFGRGGRHA